MIKYKKIQRQSQNTEVRSSHKKAVSTKEISLEIENEIGIPVIRCMSVLDAFVESLYKHLGNGEPVTLEGLGTFSTKLMMGRGQSGCQKGQVGIIQTDEGTIETVPFGRRHGRLTSRTVITGRFDSASGNETINN